MSEPLYRMLEGQRRRLTVGSKERRWERVHRTARRAPTGNLNSSAELQICRGDVLASLGSEGLCVDEDRALDAGIKVVIDLVSLRSRKVYPEMVSLDEDLSLFQVSDPAKAH